VKDRLRLEIDRLRELAEIGDLEDAAVAAVLDQEGLIAFAAEFDRGSPEVEELESDRPSLVRGEPRRRRLEDAERFVRRHAVDPMPIDPAARRRRFRAVPE
jgi:hypothetical protein